MSNTTDVKNNPGPASVIIMTGEEQLEIVCSTIIGAAEIKETPLILSEKVEEHTCEFNEEKGIAQRRLPDGRVTKADLDTLRNARNARNARGKLKNLSQGKKEAVGER